MAAQGFVHNATGRLRKVLLCAPDHFSFQPINEITKRVLAEGEQADLAAFRREHAELVDAYCTAGVTVELADPDPGLPYMVYARDFGACLAEGVLIGSFKEPVRQGEEARYARRLDELGVPVIGRITRGSFEGGDFWLLDEATVVHGVASRTTWEGVRNAAELLEPLGYTVRGVQIPSRDLHLDMAFNIVAPGVAVCATEHMPEFFLRMLEKRRFEVIDVPAEGVLLHHCNIQALGDGKVLTFAGNRAVNERLTALGLEVLAPEITQILKGGGGPHCMTFPLLREP
ncbi:MAG: nitrate reductase [Thermoleophilia bacterium]|nr:nitrate reductase [Thermoleophilia bacterium]